MRRLVLVACLAFAACESYAPQGPAPPAQAPPPAPRAPTPPAPPPRTPTGDACGAAPLQHLIGHPRSEIPVPVRPELQRVACTTCPVTQDYNQNRLNFFFDATTGIIKEIRCG